MLPFRVLSPSTAPAALTFGSRHHQPQLDVRRPAPMTCQSAQNAAVCFQSFTNSSQFTNRHIPGSLLALRTLCEKHPSVGLLSLTKFSPIKDYPLTPAESNSFTHVPSNFFRVYLFQGQYYLSPLLPISFVNRGGGWGPLAF